MGQNHSAAQTTSLWSSWVTRCSLHCLSSNIRCFRVDPSPSAPYGSERHGAPAVWSHGYTEASGVKNKSVLSLCSPQVLQTSVISSVRRMVTLKLPFLGLRFKRVQLKFS